MAKTFLGNELFGADKTIPIEERVDKAVKIVQKLSAATKAAVGLTGKGGGQPTKRGRVRNSYRGATVTTGADGTMISALATSTTRGLLTQGAVTTMGSRDTFTGAEAAATEVSALVSFVGQRGTKPSNAPRHKALMLFLRGYNKSHT